MKFWSHFHHPQAAMVLLRVTLAVLLLFHGWAKLRYGIGSIERMVAVSYTHLTLPTILLV